MNNSSGAPKLLTRRRVLGHLGSGMVTVASLAGGAWMLALSGEDAEAACLRPPGALAEDDFLSSCIRCGRCADACPNRSIVAFTPENARENSVAPGRRQRGTPVIFPRRQACILCNGAPGENLLCTEACPSGALRLTSKDTEHIREHVSMGVAEVDRNLCYSYNGASCGACVRACPLEGKALRAGLWEKPLINSEECVGCGLCERACIRYPQAIRVKPSNSRA